MKLQDWNNRREFTPPSDFHADGVNDFFISQVIAPQLYLWVPKLMFSPMFILAPFFFQATTDGTRANEILKQAPFLVPFTSRVKIFHVSDWTFSLPSASAGVLSIMKDIVEYVLSIVSLEKRNLSSLQVN